MQMKRIQSCSSFFFCSFFFFLIIYHLLKKFLYLRSRITLKRGKRKNEKFHFFFINYAFVFCVCALIENFECLLISRKNKDTKSINNDVRILIISLERELTYLNEKQGAYNF